MEQNKMGVMPVNKLIINMSLPMIVSMLVQAMYNIVDSVFVGMVSEQSLTAVSLAFPAQNLMIGVATGTAVGVNALVSRSLGARDFEKANKVAENGVFLSLLSAVAFLLFGLFGAELFMRSQTDVEFIVQEGTAYLQVCCGLSFGVYFEIIYERLLQSTGRTFYTMITQGVGAIINIILDPVFIFVFKMGVQGAAIATVIGQIAACIIAIILNTKKNSEISLNFKKFRPDGRIIGQIYKIGVPSILMVAIGSVMTFCMNKILISYTPGKETSATVYGAFFKLNSFICMPIFGLNNGVIPIIAYNYGARKRDRMLKTVKLAAVYAEMFSMLGAVLFLTIPHILLKFFSASPEMLEIGIPALRIIGSSFILAGICIALSSAFQALGKSFFSMLVSLIRQLLVLTPVAYFLARYGMQIGNPDLVWWAYPVAEFTSLIVSIIFFIYLYKTVISKIEK
ncbi:MAG: MATE family efflux transporter [Clostridia bacterium]|nr:MATE family efflux transporter [Clostridia bacterium]